jgi:lipopolysaccharide/colanic/teichoic acid biosynthesis glycosyltransferase
MNTDFAVTSHDAFFAVELDDAFIPAAPTYFASKRLCIRALGGLLLVATSPLLFLLCCLVKLTSRGPAFYGQVRVGKDRREFKILKLRSMYTDAEHITGPTWCLPGDSRITPLGKWLRFTHLDELPQLINVVKGEMDLIGPRPERPEIIRSESLEKRVAGYHHRHRVLPGVTGLAQVTLPPDQTVHCVQSKVYMDLQYIKSASVSLDVRIVLCTALQMLGLPRARSVKWLRLESGEKRLAGSRAIADAPDSWARVSPLIPPSANGEPIAQVALAECGAAVHPHESPFRRSESAVGSVSQKYPR